MTQILTITSSPKTGGSISNDMIERFVDIWRAQNPNANFTRRDVGLVPPPHLDEATIGAFFTANDQRRPEQQSAVAFSDELVGELEAADIIVIGAPMHNFSLPSGLKAWIDHVVRVGRTFRYTENGPEGLLTGKKVYVLTARGGDYSAESSIHALDHQTPYLRTILGFIGLTDVTFIHAQGVAQGDHGITRAMANIDDTITVTRSAA